MTCQTLGTDNSAAPAAQTTKARHVIMTNIEKLISISSESLASSAVACPDFLQAYRRGPELFRMLQRKNGFYAFEFALHVLPLSSNPQTGLEGWNAPSLWRGEYQDLAEGLFFFAEDALQDQFCLSCKDDRILRFHAETGISEPMGNSLDEWAEVILANFRIETGWPLLHEWQERYGPLPPGKRLMPKTPFFLGGEYKLDNLWAGNSLEGMRLKGDLAMQTRNLPNGATVKLNIGPKPE